MEDITSSIQKKSSKNNYLSILVISLGAIITTSVALSLLHIMFIKYCKRRHQRAQTLSIEPSTTIGLDNRVLNTIPILFYSSKIRDLYRINQGDQCVICLGQLGKGDLIRWLPNCGHVFHVSCIDNWFDAHLNCPICRSLVRVTGSSSSSSSGSSVCRSGCGSSGGGGGGGCRRGLPRTRSGGRLCHSTKMILPVQGLGPRDLVKFGLRRSLSMDECYVVIDTRNQTTTSPLLPNNSNNYNYNNNISSNNSSCNNPPLSKIDFLLSRLYQGPSIRRHNNNNHVFSMGSRSLHGLRTGQGGTLRNYGILPY